MHSSALRFVALAAAAFAFGCGSAPDAAAVATARSAGMDHQGMDHQGMDHQGMDHQGMDHQGMDHQGNGVYSHAIQYAGATLDGEPLHNVRIIEGDIYADLIRRGKPGGKSQYSCGKERQYGPFRNCGWKVRDVGACKPGQEVTVAAGNYCKQGSSVGNTMLRVCDGEEGCDYERGSEQLLAWDDDSCGNYQPRVVFKCPRSGRFTVMTGSYDSGAITTSNPAASGPGVVYPIQKTLHAEDLKGAEFFATEYLPDGGVGVTDLRYRIAGVEPEKVLPEEYNYYEGTSYKYTIAIQNEDGSWVTACTKNPSYNDEQVAIPVRGRWDNTGAKLDSNTEFTFGCTSGVVAKCYRWGYRPWLSPQMWDVHQACTRMARADYCGDGTSWTKDGTAINHWDDLAVPVSKPDNQDAYNEPGGYFFEAAWDVTGARCLSHERWYNLPAGFAVDRCPFRLLPPEAPTYNFGAFQIGPTVCDTEAEATVKWPSTVHFNKSRCNGSANGC